MEIVDMNKEINKQFCDIVGIKPVFGILINTDTGEVRKYFSKSIKYKHPKNWKNIKTTIFDKPIYPDLLEPNNFIELINCQWEIFGQLGNQYFKNNTESFQENYITTRTLAIKMCKLNGGGEMLQIYFYKLKDIKW